MLSLAPEGQGERAGKVLPSTMSPLAARKPPVDFLNHSPASPQAACYYKTEGKYVPLEIKRLGRSL